MQRTFTREEVASRCSSENCWVIVENRVVNVTQYMNDHPGGEVEVFLNLIQQIYGCFKCKIIEKDDPK